MPSARWIVWSAVLLLFAPAPSRGQSMADTYRMAAQAYTNAAAQCQNPAGAMCLRKNAEYQICLANQLAGGPSCGNPPPCSTSCIGGGSAGSGGSVPLLTPSMAISPKADAIGNLVALGISLFMKDKSNEQPATEENNVDPAALAAQMAAAEKQRRDAEASDILQKSNNLFESINGSSSPPTAPSSTVNLDVLFDNGQPSDASTSAINALLGNSDQSNANSSDPTSTVTGLLSQDATADSDPNQPNPTDTNENAAQPPNSSANGSHLSNQDSSVAGNATEDTAGVRSPSADSGESPSNAAGDFYNEVSGSALRDEVPLVMAVAEGQDPSLQPLNDGVKRAMSFSQTYKAFQSSEQYYQDLTNNSTTFQQNAQVVQNLGTQTPSSIAANPAANYAFKISYSTNTMVQNQSLNVLNSTMGAVESGSTYGLDTDINKVPYAFASNLPFGTTIQKLGAVVTWVQNTEQAIYKKLYPND